MSPQHPTKSDIPPEDKVDPLANGEIRITTTRSAGYPLYIEWTLDTGVFPADAKVVSVETRVCGHGEGDFYEVYGPYGSDPVEYEVKPPAADGCWHFVGEGSDYDVTVYVYDDAVMTIERIEFVVTFDR
jgi:hypothetical protein